MLRRLTRPEVQALIDDYQSGMSVCEAARKHHVHPQTATRWLVKAGLPIRHRTGVPPDRVNEAIALRASGWTWKQLGERYDCSHTAVWRALHKQTSEHSSY